MATTYTVNKGLVIPGHGEMVGTWDTAGLNPDLAAVDGILGGFLTLSPSGATTITLSVPAGSLTPGAGPTQSQNSLIKFTGTLTGNAVIKFTLPGFYIVHNSCGSAFSYSIQLSPSAGVGNTIAAPPGRKTHVFFDGTDMDFVDMPEVGSALDLHGITSTPVWMSACTVKPYLVKDGTVYNVSSYPQLAQVLGSTFGGNGVSTFGVPDERARARIALDTLSVVTGTYAGRLTVVGSGVNGTTMAAVGGSELMQSHSHTATVTDPGHSHNPPNLGSNTQNGGNSFIVPTGYVVGTNAGFNTSTSTTNITVAVNGTGSGSSGNVMPVVVSFLPLIKT